MLYERPEALPAIEQSSRSFIGVIVSTEAAPRQSARQAWYEVDMAPRRKARKLRHLKRDMDRVSIVNAIAATRGPAISFLVDKEASNLKKEWQPAELWKFLEVITKASLVPAREYFQE